jgi:hypothetical protein
VKELSIRHIHTGEQYVPMLCVRESGQRTVPCVGGDIINGIYRIEISPVSHDHSVTIEYHGAPYSISRFLDYMAAIQERTGGSVEAIDLLSEIDPGRKWKHHLTAAIGEARLNQEEPGDRIRDAINVLNSICKELKMEPARARKLLRGAGLRAPYTDARRIRDILNANDH